MQWGGDTSTIGFNAGDGIRHFTLSDRFTSTESTLDLETSSNVGIPGVYIFRVDQEEIMVPRGILNTCRNLYFNTSRDAHNNTELIGKMECRWSGYLSVYLHCIVIIIMWTIIIAACMQQNEVHGMM